MATGSQNNTTCKFGNVRNKNKTHDRIVMQWNGMEERKWGSSILLLFPSAFSRLRKISKVSNMTTTTHISPVFLSFSSRKSFYLELERSNSVPVSSEKSELAGNWKLDAGLDGEGKSRVLT